jgi:hypothetical protein
MLPRNRLTSVLFVAAPMHVAQDHEILVIFGIVFLISCKG